MSNQLTLYILSTRQQIVVPIKDKAILGRSNEVESDGTVHIDLSPFLAYQLGVSRRHLKLVREEDKVMAYDLSSSNGSFVNGDKISSSRGRPLKDGDELTLGSLSMRVYFSEDIPYNRMQTRTLAPVKTDEQEEQNKEARRAAISQKSYHIPETPSNVDSNSGLSNH